MSGNKSTFPGIKGVIKIAGTEKLWSWHVLHRDAVTKGFVHPSRVMLLFCSFEFLLLLHVHSNLSSKLH